MIRPILAALTVACLSSTAFAESCVASRYGGGRTASGERMNASAMTAAHRFDRSAPTSQSLHIQLVEALRSE